MFSVSSSVIGPQIYRPPNLFSTVQSFYLFLPVQAVYHQTGIRRPNDFAQVQPAAQSLSCRNNPSASQGSARFRHQIYIFPSRSACPRSHIQRPSAFSPPVGSCKASRPADHIISRTHLTIPEHFSGEFYGGATSAKKQGFPDGSDNTPWRRYPYG